MVPFLWQLAQHFNVMAHEGAHALGLEELTSYAMAWLLLLSGLRIAIAHGVNASDA